jgi:hypothetical protein
MGKKVVTPRSRTVSSEYPCVKLARDAVLTVPAFHLHSAKKAFCGRVVNYAHIHSSKDVTSAKLTLR